MIKPGNCGFVGMYLRIVSTNPLFSNTERGMLTAILIGNRLAAKSDQSANARRITKSASAVCSGSLDGGKNRLGV